MAKKLKRRLNDDNHIIKRGEFSTETAKLYIVFSILVFHILPLIFVFMGETGMQILFNMFLFTINIVMLFGIGLFYGVKIGFNFKFPLLLSLLAVLSYVFYYNSKFIFQNPENYVMTGIIMLIVYLIFSFASTAAGGWVKRFFP